MTIDEAVAKYASLSREIQIAVLAYFAFRLTILSRETYAPPPLDVADPKRLREHNEVQHCVTGHLCKLLASDPRRYDDDAIVRIAVGEGEVILLHAFELALERGGTR